MSRPKTELSNSISIFWLNRHGFIPVGGGWASGSLVWTIGVSKSSVGFSVSIKQSSDDHLQLNYTHTDNLSGDKEPLDYRVALTTTPCRYGGVRYWFKCPLTKNGQPCGRRVGILYCVGKYFGCRTCGDIVYSSQMQGGKYRTSSVSVPDIEYLEKQIHRYYYRGQPTRKYLRLQKMNQKLLRDLQLVAGVLNLDHATN